MGFLVHREKPCHPSSLYLHLAISQMHDLEDKGPKLFWHQTGFVEDNFLTDGGGGGQMFQVVMRVMESNGEQQMTLCPLLTSRCVAQFLAGCRPVLAGLGMPALGDLDIVCDGTYHFSTVHIGKCSCEPS